MPVRSADPPGPGPAGRPRRRHAAPRADDDPSVETFRVASRDRLIPRQREGAPGSPRISYEVVLAVAVVVACMCGAMVVGAAFTLQV